MKKPFQIDDLTQTVIRFLNPYTTFSGIVSGCPGQLQIEDFTLKTKDKIHLFGIGKSASSEISAFLKRVDELNCNFKLGRCMALTKYDHSVKEDRIEQLEGSHPLIEEVNLKNSLRFTKAMSELPADEPMIFFLSGGASALLEVPRSEVDFMTLKNIYADLVKSGMNINAMNEIRKGLSKTKNGGLLNSIKSQRILQFITCDIPNETLADVGSGPLLFKPLNWDNINSYLKKHSIELDPLEPPVNKVEKSILGQSASRLMDRLAKEYPNSIKGSIYDGLSNEVVIDLKSKIPAKKQVFHISGGEGTVKVGDNPGIGGRNTHFVLEMACHIYQDPSYRDVHILSLGTDGTDGDTDAAGAYINYSLFAKLDTKEYLANFNSYEYFKELGTLIKTGPTQSNVMDVRFLWRE